MPLIPLACPSCGSNLTVDSDKDAAICEFCGKPYIVKDAIVNNYINMHISQATINAESLNLITRKDFEIQAGNLIKYTGEKQEIVIPNSVKKIGDEAFSGLNITSVLIPDTVISIGISAFKGCKELKKVEIPDSVTEIGANAFEYSGIEEIKLSNNIKSILPGTFQYCMKLKSIKIPDNVTIISSSAFSACVSLKEVIMSPNVSVGFKAFSTTPFWKGKCQQCGKELSEAPFVDKMRGFNKSCKSCGLVYK